MPKKQQQFPCQIVIIRQVRSNNNTNIWVDDAGNRWDYNSNCCIQATTNQLKKE